MSAYIAGGGAEAALSPSVWIAADTLDYPEGAGHLWSYLNWALGLRAAGAEVVWMEAWRGTAAPSQLTGLADQLRGFGLERLCLYDDQGADATPAPAAALTPVAAAESADLLLNVSYELPAGLRRRFSRTALLDIDPGMTQTWAASGAVELAAHDVYLTIGEAIATGKAAVPASELRWLYVSPCVALDRWPFEHEAAGESYSTITHWWGDGSFVMPNGRVIDNSKRASFLSFLELPGLTGVEMELATPAEDLEEDAELLLSHGWKLAEPREAAGTLERYRSYVAGSRGEFSCAKPAYVQLATGWVSDRTVCYLASGRPAILQDTGPCRALDEAEGQGVFRFRDMEGAISALSRAEREHGRQCALARKLAEERFDARANAARLLELCLP